MIIHLETKQHKGAEIEISQIILDKILIITKLKHLLNK